MSLVQFTQLAALIAVLGNAVVYGTDVFCAMVLRPALARVDDRALGAVAGYVHRYGDRRMPVPGAIGVAAAAVSAALAALASNWAQAISAGVAVVLLLVWLLLYIRVSAPINRQLTAAAESGQVLPDARLLQANWDRIISARAVLQALALAALCLVLIADPGSL
jgi:ABC-type branched-subunit amino acid transport system permease subunit